MVRWGAAHGSLYDVIREDCPAPTTDSLLLLLINPCCLIVSLISVHVLRFEILKARALPARMEALGFGGIIPERFLFGIPIRI
jgi:hypothetical protein